jgi:hypothetical protein
MLTRRNTCLEYLLLRQQLVLALRKVNDTTNAQLAAFRANDQPAFLRLYEDLHDAEAQKSLAIHALRFHRRLHRCQLPSS